MSARGSSTQLMGSMGTLAEQQADATYPAVYLPRVATNIFTPSAAPKPTVITAPADTDFGSGQVSLTAQQLSELSLTVMPGSVVDANGNPVATRPSGSARCPPRSCRTCYRRVILQHTFDITIQAPEGAVFTQPATLTVPNTMGLAPGSRHMCCRSIIRHGRLVIDGTATVSADGSTITTNPGSGITAPGWHGFTPAGATLASISMYNKNMCMNLSTSQEISALSAIAALFPTLKDAPTAGTLLQDFLYGNGQDVALAQNSNVAAQIRSSPVFNSALNGALASAIAQISASIDGGRMERRRRCQCRYPPSVYTLLAMTPIIV